MLDILRANTRSVLTYVLFGIIIVVFVVSFGPGSKGCTDTNVRVASYAAKVNGTTITAAEYEQTYANLFKAYQARAGQAFTRELADQLGLRSMAMNQLVDRELVVDEAQRHGIVVTDDDLSRAIQQIPSFQTSGKFDMELYKRAVAYQYGSPAKFEERVRRALAFEKMLALLRQTVKVSDDDVRQAWLAESDRVSLKLVRFPIAAAKSEVKLSDAQVQAFAAANAPRIEQFYRDNPSRFDRKKRVHARHILVKVADNAPAAEEEAARKKIDAVAERLKKGEDFAKVAKEVSDDPGSKENGGDLGFFGEGVMAKPFEEAAFALKPGQTSAPVRTRFGWHLIQALAVEEPKKVTLEQARPEIARDLAEEEGARKLADARARAALARVEAGQKLEDLFPPAGSPAAKKAGAAARLGNQTLSAEDTGPFARSGDVVPVAGSVPALVQDAFAAAGPKPLPKVYESGAGPIVAVVTQRQKPDEAQFSSKREEIANRLRMRRETQMEQAWMKSVREKAKVEVNEAFLRGEVAAPAVDLE